MGERHRVKAHVCQIVCGVECRHGVSCDVYGDLQHEHPVERGHLHHTGWDGARFHVWNGAAGLCRIEEPAEEGTEP